MPTRTPARSVTTGSEPGATTADSRSPSASNRWILRYAATLVPAAS